MSQTRLRLVIFYIASILGVGILFTTVTRFGETQLHAAENIEGIYQLELAEPESSPKSFLYQCLKSDSAQQKSILLLAIHQSGLFLNASLQVWPTTTPADADFEKVREKRPTLIGEWHQTDIVVQGKLSPAFRSACPTFNPSSNQEINPDLQVQFSFPRSTQDVVAGKLLYAKSSDNAQPQAEQFVGKLIHRLSADSGPAKGGH